MKKTSPLPLALLVAASLPWPLTAMAQSCAVRSGERVAPVIELYTSEGCSSCPPADRWLSRRTSEPDVVALAFHVDYWDRLGWSDRYATPSYTHRQVAQQAVNGARYAYTPQVVIDGVDRPGWSRGATDAARARAHVEIALDRRGEQFEATVKSIDAQRLGAYWAVTEDGHRSAVQAGENAGVTLQHDAVVRELRPVDPWQASIGTPTVLRFRPTTVADPAHPRQVKLIVLDASTGRPLQAVKLGC